MRAERLLLLALVIGALDCAYLSWRFVALHEVWVTPGTGICSWTAWVDCDCVLRTPQARAFYVPNAILGLGFFGGCLLWWLLGRRRPAAQQRLILGLLAGWLGLATAFTFYFFYLMTTLPCLCPFCPWNHFFTWVAFGAALRLRRTMTEEDSPTQKGAPLSALSTMIALCVGWFVLCNGTWLLLRGF